MPPLYLPYSVAAFLVGAAAFSYVLRPGPPQPTTKAVIPVRTVSYTPPTNLTNSFWERWKEQIAYPTAMTREEVEVDEQPSLDEQTRERSYRNKRKTRTSDICTRHNMHKVYYGRRWRCRR